MMFKVMLTLIFFIAIAQVVAVIIVLCQACREKAVYIPRQSSTGNEDYYREMQQQWACDELIRMEQEQWLTDEETQRMQRRRLIEDQNRQMQEAVAV